MILTGRLFVILTALFLAACDPYAQAPISSTAIIGTKAIIKTHSEQRIAEVTDVTGKIVTTEFTNWEGELLYTQLDYRGLFPVGGSEHGGGQWELDFDQNLLEPLFPLQKGKEVSFKANLKTIADGGQHDMWVHMEVIGEKSISLPDGQHPVLLVELSREYKWNGKIQRSTDVMYFDPKLSMTLKKVIRQRGVQTYWRVVSIERPGHVEQATPTRQRRSGTVMI